MGLITKEVELSPRGSLIKYYRDKGYVFNYGDTITVKIEDVSKNSHVMVDCICDFGNEPIRMKYQDYNKQMDGVLAKVCCNKCKINKSKVTNMIKYGVENVAQKDEFKEKLKQTCLNKYGCESYAQTKEFIERYKKNNLEKYGVEWAICSNEVRTKIKKTMNEIYGSECVFYIKEIQDKIKKTIYDRYGVLNISQNKEIQEKKKKTCLEHYGCEYSLQSPIIRERMAKTYNKNQTISTSKQQIYISNLYNMKLNYPILCWNVDMCDEINKNIVEYDGGGHFLSVKLGSMSQQEFSNREIYREKAIRAEGYRIIRIISKNDDLPSDEILLQMLLDAKQYFSDYPNHSWITFDIDEGIVKNAECKEGRSYFYGELRRIKKENLESA